MKHYSLSTTGKNLNRPKEFERELIDSIPFMRSYCKKRYGDEQLDIIQDTLYIALKDWKKFDNKYKLISWLISIINNLNLQERDKIHEKLITDELGHIPEKLTEDRNLYDEALYEELERRQKKKLKKAISHLTNYQKEILNLWLEGKSLDRIAEYKNRTKTGIKSHLTTIRKILKEDIYGTGK